MRSPSAPEPSAPPPAPEPSAPPLAPEPSAPLWLRNPALPLWLRNPALPLRLRLRNPALPLRLRNPALPSSSGTQHSPSGSGTQRSPPAPALAEETKPAPLSIKQADPSNTQPANDLVLTLPAPAALPSSHALAGEAGKACGLAPGLGTGPGQPPPHQLWSRCLEPCCRPLAGVRALHSRWGSAQTTAFPSRTHEVPSALGEFLSWLSQGALDSAASRPCSSTQCCWTSEEPMPRAGGKGQPGERPLPLRLPAGGSETEGSPPAGVWAKPRGLCSAGS